MNNNQIESVIRKLFETGRSFCSEADFQHALGSAIEKHLADKSVAVRFEFPASKENNEHFDIMLISDGKMNPVELKYKTKHAEVRDSKGDIQYVLRDQAAHDCGRFLFLKDICRLEKYRTEKKETYGHGFAVFLTNDPLYMQQAKGLISRDLSLNCGICKGEKYLNTDAMWARQYKRFEIHDNYETVWHKVVLDGIEFFYLLIEVA